MKLGGGGWRLRWVLTCPPGAPEMVLSPRREHHFRLGGCAGRPRVPEGGSGRLPELMLGSPKVILELPGAHFGFSEGHF